MIPLKAQDGYEITIEFLPGEDVDMKHHFMNECGMSRHHFNKIRDFVWFTTKVTAWKDGIALGDNYLGCCCHESYEEAVQTEIGGYLPQMIDEAIQEARDS